MSDLKAIIIFTLDFAIPAGIIGGHFEKANDIKREAWHAANGRTLHLEAEYQDNYTFVDDSTGDVYKLDRENGVLVIKEVR